MQGLLQSKAIKRGTMLGILTLVVASAVFFLHAAPSAHADAHTDCIGKQLATAQDSANGYSLGVAVVAQFGRGGDAGTGYCGSMKTSATMTVPAGGLGGTLTVTLIGDTTGSVTNTYTFPNANAGSGYTFTEYSPSAGPKCGIGTATFTVSNGQVISATTKKVCPK